MSRSSMARVAAAAASGALVVAGVTVGVGFGAGTAAAAGTCNQSSQVSKSDITTLGITHNYSKTVSAAEASPGTEVTYTTVVSTTGIGNPYVNTINDIPPAGFGAPVKATVTAYQVGIPTGEHESEVTPTQNGNGWKVTNTGWSVNSSNPVTLKMTYKVPDNAALFSQVTSGGTGVAGTVGVSNEMPNLTACFTVRLPNAGEATTGSLDMAGLGSSEGQLSSTGSVSDVLGDTITKALKNGS
ncbi:hypothetical protein FK531_10260 [Rhodococcus spelaei]|uniref:DUF11 domain-containing protein n=1 Tax=Rhodococcus spelaei TaxID=2546320 RepID=A0A541B9Y7_9NOCA|nr:hypothetical protein [Rhodococcus spelaei]TQF69142.1 hypothetical protein FK531_10260 [Rhodococcus spelaei]